MQYHSSVPQAPLHQGYHGPPPHHQPWEQGPPQHHPYWPPPQHYPLEKQLPPPQGRWWPYPQQQQHQQHQQFQHPLPQQRPQAPPPQRQQQQQPEPKQHSQPPPRQKEPGDRHTAAAAAAAAAPPYQLRDATPNPRPSKRHRESGHSSSPSSSAADKAAEQQQPQQQPLGQQDGPAPAVPAAWQDVLRQDVLRFAAQVVPTPQEQQRRQAALTAIDAAARSALTSTGRTFNVQEFGSGRSGLALHCSDLDVVILGLASPTEANGGFNNDVKRFITSCLRKVEGAFRRRMGVTDRTLIAHARIPLLKLKLPRGVELDVSLNDTGGIKAANFLRALVNDFAVMKPLVLVLKTILKRTGLGDVASGGLGGWSLCNMVVAHLMEEERTGGQVQHEGAMLASFLRRFGVGWDLNNHAVAVAQGGIVPRASLDTPGYRFGARDKLVIKDPLTGRDVAGGSHRYADVARLFADLHNSLAADAAAAASGRGGDFKVLGLLLDCERVLQRPWPGVERPPRPRGEGWGVQQGPGANGAGRQQQQQQQGGDVRRVMTARRSDYEDAAVGLRKRDRREMVPTALSAEQTAAAARLRATA